MTDIILALDAIFLVADWGLVALAFILLVIDWRQTLWIFAHWRRELNPAIRWLYGRFGNNGIHGYFAAWIAGCALVTTQEWAIWPLGAVALLEAVVTVRNWRRGIRP